jgi:RimJ/RimL family protein N-acetyltransferase
MMTGVGIRQGVARRPATPSDIPMLRELYADAHLELACLPIDTRFVLVDMQFRAQRRRFAIQYPDARREILVVDGVDAGQLVVDETAELVELVDISVGLRFRREGVAGAVLASVIAEAGDRAVQTTVWSGNTAALALVQRAGLVPVGDEAGYLTMRLTPAAAAASS